MINEANELANNVIELEEADKLEEMAELMGSKLIEKDRKSRPVIDRVEFLEDLETLADMQGYSVIYFLETAGNHLKKGSGKGRDNLKQMGKSVAIQEVVRMQEEKETGDVEDLVSDEIDLDSVNFGVEKFRHDFIDSDYIRDLVG